MSLLKVYAVAVIVELVLLLLPGLGRSSRQ